VALWLTSREDDTRQQEEELGTFLFFLVLSPHKVTQHPAARPPERPRTYQAPLKLELGRGTELPCVAHGRLIKKRRRTRYRLDSSAVFHEDGRRQRMRSGRAGTQARSEVTGRHGQPLRAAWPGSLAPPPGSSSRGLGRPRSPQPANRS
jgi:hypothetical protein